MWSNTLCNAIGMINDGLNVWKVTYSEVHVKQTCYKTRTFAMACTLVGTIHNEIWERVIKEW